MKHFAKGSRNWYLARQIEEPVEKWVRVENFLDNPQPRPVGLINGGFDILHASHLRLIAEARVRSRTLIAALDSNAKIRARKGEGRPIFTWTQRAAALGYVGVDWVVEIDEDEEFLELCRVVVPEFRMLGAEYIGAPSRVPWIKAIYVREGMEHTSDIIERIKHG